MNTEFRRRFDPQEKDFDKATLQVFKEDNEKLSNQVKELQTKLAEAEEAGSVVPSCGAWEQVDQKDASGS